MMNASAKGANAVTQTPQARGYLINDTPKHLERLVALRDDLRTYHQHKHAYVQRFKEQLGAL